MRPVYSKILFIAGIVLSVAASARADGDFSGKYSDGNVTIELRAAPGGYTGTLHAGSNDYVLKATTNGAQLTGTFQSDGSDFSFNGTFDGNTLHFSSGRKNYSLTRQSPANPLDGSAAPQNPLASSNASSDAPAGYNVILATDFGKSLQIDKPGLKDVTTVLQSIFPDLAGYFRNRPALIDAYEDSKSHKAGGATFSGTWNNQPIHGLVSIKLTDSGASVSVVFARTDATPDQWKRLSVGPAPTTAPSDAQTPQQAAAAKFNLKEFTFPDNTGSISLADGWTTKTQSLLDVVGVTGPADQSIVANTAFIVITTDSPQIQMYNRAMQLTAQNKASFERMGRPYNPPPLKSPQESGSIVMDYCGPVDAIDGIMKQKSAYARANNLPTFDVTDITEVKKLPKAPDGGDMSVLTWITTEHVDGGDKRYKINAIIWCSPATTGFWMVRDTQVRSPEATFDQDKPLMFAMLNSIKRNDAVYNQVSQQRLNAMNQTAQANLAVMGAAENKVLAITRQMGEDNMNTQNRIYQEQHTAQVQGYAEHNAQVQNEQLQQQRAAADVSEYALGLREIYDTKSGQSADVDLFHSHAIVNTLNADANDPGRYVEIPLKDKLYPEP